MARSREELRRLTQDRRQREWVSCPDLTETAAETRGRERQQAGEWGEPHKTRVREIRVEGERRNETKQVEAKTESSQKVE